MVLNAGATNFSPGEADDIVKCGQSVETAERTRDSFSVYKQMVENIDEVMNRDPEQQQHNVATPVDIIATIDGKNNIPTVQCNLPSYMAKHAAEFWFPECRDCMCCQGFKHGCMCAASNGGNCACGTGAPDDVSVITASTIGNNNHLSHPQFAPNGSRNSGSRANNRNRDRGRSSSKASCRFFFSKAGCRYGDACTFDHTQKE